VHAGQDRDADQSHLNPAIVLAAPYKRLFPRSGIRYQ